MARPWHRDAVGAACPWPQLTRESTEPFSFKHFLRLFQIEKARALFGLGGAGLQGLAAPLTNLSKLKPGTYKTLNSYP